MFDVKKTVKILKIAPAIRAGPHRGPPVHQTGNGMSATLFVVTVVVITALIFDFTNGFHDSSNAMATSVAE